MKQFAYSSKAKELLASLYYETQDIIIQKGYHIGWICEFYPDDPCYLGCHDTNKEKGDKINLRLREPENSDIFLPFEEILETLLHEICHCEIGPHNDKFKALLKTLLVGMKKLGFSRISSRSYFLTVYDLLLFC